MAIPPHVGSEPVVPRTRIEQPIVQAATGDDVPRLSGVLAEAFINDPLYTWMLPGRLRVKSRLRTLFAADLEQYVLRNGGTVWATTDYEGAVAVLPPGAWEFPKSLTGKDSLKWLRAFGTRSLLAARVQRLMEARHLQEPHFYVRLLGVHPTLQGRGLGSALMAPTLERADSAGLPTYLEASSDRSAALYERLGFAHLDLLELPGGPPVWPMRRPPPGSTHQPADG
jgi:GNAT superfamily N-acetyltransferase